MRKLSAVLLVTLLLTVTIGWSKAPQASSRDASAHGQTMKKISGAWAANGLWAVISSTGAISTPAVSQNGGSVALSDGQKQREHQSMDYAAAIELLKQKPCVSDRMNRVIEDTLRIPDISPDQVNLAVIQQLQQNLERLSTATAQVPACRDETESAPRDPSWSTPTRASAARDANHSAKTTASPMHTTVRGHGSTLHSAPGSSGLSATSVGRTGSGHHSVALRNGQTTPRTARPNFSAGSAHK